MTYSNKVKASQTIVNAINGLTDGQYIIVTYGTDYNNEPLRFKITCHVYKSGSTTYSIYRDEVFGLSGMNIEALNKTTMDAYSYDMMNQRSTYRFALDKMELVEQPFLPQDHDYKF